MEFCIIKAAHLNFCPIKIMLGKLFFYLLELYAKKASSFYSYNDTLLEKLEAPEFSYEKE